VETNVYWLWLLSMGSLIFLMQAGFFLADITKIDRSQRPFVKAAALYTRQVQAAYPDQTIHEVVERMREHHLANFPVVSRREEKQLLGMVTKSDIVLAYRQVAVNQ
jgi:CBS domain-containing protein